eukprot:6208036-Pleurochrysis_carterae.AAC.1
MAFSPVQLSANQMCYFAQEEDKPSSKNDAEAQWKALAGIDEVEMEVEPETPAETEKPYHSVPDVANDNCDFEHGVEHGSAFSQDSGIDAVTLRHAAEALAGASQDASSDESGSQQSSHLPAPLFTSRSARPDLPAAGAELCHAARTTTASERPRQPEPKQSQLTSRLGETMLESRHPQEDLNFRNALAEKQVRTAASHARVADQYGHNDGRFLFGVEQSAEGQTNDSLPLSSDALLSKLEHDFGARFPIDKDAKLKSSTTSSHTPHFNAGALYSAQLYNVKLTGCKYSCFKWQAKWLRRNRSTTLRFEFATHLHRHLLRSSHLFWGAVFRSPTHGRQLAQIEQLLVQLQKAYASARAAKSQSGVREGLRRTSEALERAQAQIADVFSSCLPQPQSQVVQKAYKALVERLAKLQTTHTTMCRLRKDRGSRIQVSCLERKQWLPHRGCSIFTFLSAMLIGCGCEEHGPRSCPKGQGCHSLSGASEARFAALDDLVLKQYYYCIPLRHGGMLSRLIAAALEKLWPCEQTSPNVTENFRCDFATFPSSQHRVRLIFFSFRLPLLYMPSIMHPKISFSLMCKTAVADNTKYC